MKRLFDIIVSLTGLVLLSPILLTVIFLIWLQDFSSPLYIASRVGKNGKMFKMVKLRSMMIHADKSGVDSTALDDDRITWIGNLIRRYKLDEFSQLWNVLWGDMSLVGPRPNVPRGVAVYTTEERRLLNIRPGITDFASIVFSDEGNILVGAVDPDLKYNQIIRPWKSRLGLFYIEKRSFLLDLRIIWLTIVAILSRPRALCGVQRILQNLDASPQLVKIAGRAAPLQHYHPPGSEKEVMTRDPISVPTTPIDYS
jgi:lipopolysaccharide/colanic/teichoic acid biosynthesis glycosyltransferase